LVPVKGRLPCDWRVLTLWSVCGWQVKLCDSLVTHGPCLTFRCCPAWQPLLCGWAIWLDYNKSSFIFIYYQVFIPAWQPVCERLTHNAALRVDCLFAG